MYRVTDILVENDDGNFRLYAAYHHWNSEQKCSVIRISVAEGQTAGLANDRQPLEWRDVYQTSPCLPITKGRGGDLFKGGDSGGRMVMVGDGKLLLTVGDYQYDGWNREAKLAQQEDVAYGKTVLIDLDSGESVIYSSGHRNPQGLFVDGDGTIWSTEHGPQGGDELNVIERGANYGWPLVTYGVDYGSQEWPLSLDQGNHTGFKRPFAAWVPSIAVSNLIAVEGDGFPLWKGDLLVASYKRSLRRLRIREGRVIYQEPIVLLKRNGRIRDLMEDREGRLVVWFDSGYVGVFEVLQKEDETEAVHGRRLFVQCSGCHNDRANRPHTIGPNLFGIIGREIGAATGFDYSNAMRKRSDIWTEAKLNAYIQNPSAFIPGTTMHFDGVPEALDRQRVIGYLQKQK